MSLESQIIAIGQVMLTAFLSMVIGLDRERLGKSAGVRTHMLAGLGACLFTVVSRDAFPGGDPSRVAAGVVTGIGFLGAGVVFRQGGNVHDLTTAASIWATAAVGVAVASNAWLLAIGSTVIVWTILAVMRRIKPYQDVRQRRRSQGIGDASLIHDAESTGGVEPQPD